MNKVIITGANGFIGSALTKELLENGYDVCAVVHNGHMNNIPNDSRLTIVSIDSDEMLELRDVIAPGHYDIFYHFAWKGSTGNDRAAYEIQLMNVKWTLDAVSVANDLGCKRFVGAGTIAEHDVNAYVPLDGSTPNAVSNYGAAKIAAHYMSKAECNRLGVDHVWAYLSNNFGEGNYTSNFVNFVSKTLLTGKPANFTAGDQPYDFLYIRDTAQGLRCIGEKGKKNNAYYIGSTKPKKLKEFVTIIRDTIDPSIKINLGAVPFNGVKQPVEIFDCTKLVKDTGYKPNYTFEQGIERTIPWIKRQIEEGKL